QQSNWWDRIVEWFKGLFNKAGYNPFEQVASQVVRGEFEGRVKPTMKNLADRINEKDPVGIFGEAFRAAYEVGEYGEAVDMFRQQLADPETFQTTVDSMLGGDVELGQ